MSVAHVARRAAAACKPSALGLSAASVVVAATAGGAAYMLGDLSTNPSIMAVAAVASNALHAAKAALS